MALALTAQITANYWTGPKCSTTGSANPASVGTGLRAQAQIGAAATVGWVAAEATPLDEARQKPPEATAPWARLRGAPAAVAQTEGHHDTGPGL